MTDIRWLPGPIIEKWEWQLSGACRDEDPTLFFHPEGERGPIREAREGAAKAICRRCPVIRECAAHALASREPYGVWGGMSESEREQLLGARSTHRLGARLDLEVAGTGRYDRLTQAAGGGRGSAYGESSQYAESQYSESQYAESQYAESQYAGSQYAELQYAEGETAAAC